MVLPRIFTVVITLFAVETASVLGAPVREGTFKSLAARSGLPPSQQTDFVGPDKFLPKRGVTAEEESKSLSPVYRQMIAYIERHPEAVDHWKFKSAVALLCKGHDNSRARPESNSQGDIMLKSVVEQVEKSTKTKFVNEPRRKILFVDENISSLSPEWQRNYRIMHNYMHHENAQAALDSYVKRVEQATGKKLKDFDPSEDKQAHAASSSHPTARKVGNEGNVDS